MNGADDRNINRESICLSQLADVLRGEIAWMRVYPEWKHEKSEDLMTWPEIMEYVRAYGDRKVKKLYPGYRFVMVYLA